MVFSKQTHRSALGKLFLGHHPFKEDGNGAGIHADAVIGAGMQWKVKVAFWSQRQCLGFLTKLLG